MTERLHPSQRWTVWGRLGRRSAPLLLLVLLGLGVGLWLGRDYGMTVDEERNAAVGEAALSAYVGGSHYYDLPNLDEHGPAYFMLFASTSKLIADKLAGWGLPDGRHLTNFVMFLLACVAFYFIARRMLDDGLAWVATLIFGTQPLLFGHAFINQKDIPFMALFTATVAVGLAAGAAMAEGGTDRRPEALPGTDGVNGLWEALKADAGRLRPIHKRVSLPLIGLAALVALDLLFFGGLQSLARHLIAAAYAGRAAWPIQPAFNAVATDAYKTPLSMYLDKFDVAWFSLRLVVPPALLLAGVALACGALPSLRRALGLNWKAVRQWKVSWALGATTVLLGLTICVRQLGVFAGVLVSLYVYQRGLGRALIGLVGMWILAATVTVATWPYLWPNPVSRFFESLYVAAHFPTTHVTFYRGDWVQAGAYPWYYLPNLTGIELTETAVLLIVGGAALAVIRTIRRDPDWPLLVLLGLWAGVPAAGLMFFHLTTYGNISHLLFALPPLFLLAGLALAWVWARLRRGALRAALLAAVLLPGLLGIARLHPYEYIYINSLAGGVGRADGFYELDRWCISIREAIEDLNAIAPPGSTVMLPSDYHPGVPFARSDLQLIDNRTSYAKADYVVACSWVHDLGPWPEQEFVPIFEVGRGGAVLTRVWQRAAPPE